MRISSASFLSSMTLASLLYFLWFPVGWEIRLLGFHLDHTLAVWLRATDLNSLCTITCLQNGDNRCYLHLGLLNVLNEMAHGKHLAKYQANSKHSTNVNYYSSSYYSGSVRGAQNTEWPLQCVSFHCLLNSSSFVEPFLPQSVWIQSSIWVVGYNQSF